ncbi:hypothetical protein BCR41DRAFT_352301 [Lobosporangium transversale]|uniref:MARVEL domain-containing protein n=1 Tax=Lobosporangium transversale TaxID=64571 RepID=A0A1Y2GUB5_9FUNG|nr:hypothetical protein BCR41DRAFT_352301 [Lobosporangium transversale]ORZ18394.1 hypothetical protein BCR41DRAFT_352301 [Lobosporangium transversale]|eukprot:XP_021882189.1 hypothetical protein BCR41DRAFT_352301 [Lobosporangium transversale]
MGLFDKFFGVIPPAAGAMGLGVLYTIIGLVFAILSFGRWIMPHAETDLYIPWGVVCILLFVTGIYGTWATAKGTTWHLRQYVSFSWGFLLMFLCWAVVYIAVEDNHVEKVNAGCIELNKDKNWTEAMCNERREKAVTISIALVTIAMVLGFYFTLVLSKWVSGREWEDHLEEERRLDQWRSGHGEKPGTENNV